MIWYPHSTILSCFFYKLEMPKWMPLGVLFDSWTYFFSNFVRIAMMESGFQVATQSTNNLCLTLVRSSRLKALNNVSFKVAQLILSIWSVLIFTHTKSWEDARKKFDIFNAFGKPWNLILTSYRCINCMILWPFFKNPVFLIPSTCANGAWTSITHDKFVCARQNLWGLGLGELYNRTYDLIVDFYYVIIC